jgi:predicted DNA-binding transcriptional regulator YafY
MYSPTTRLLTILELLQSYRQMSGTEIARRLEVDGRTVRRYIVMLQDMGIPVEAERGPYGAYQLRRGYKLPPLMFTDAEAIALTLALLAVREFRFPVDVAAIEGALAKTERVMPEKLLQQARALQEAITFSITPPPAPLQNNLVTELSSAVQQRQRVHLSYRSYSGAETERDFNPYGIVFHENVWYTTGYCHLRQDLRTFRLDRITRLETGEQSFERPDSFDAVEHVIHSLASMPREKPARILLKTTLEHAGQWIAPTWGTLEETEGGVIFSPAAHLDWFAYLLLNFDFPVVILESDELKSQMRALAARAMEIADAEA